MRLPVLLKRKIASLIKTMIPTPVGAVPSRLRQRHLQDRSLSVIFIASTAISSRWKAADDPIAAFVS